MKKKLPSKPELERALAHSEKVGKALSLAPTWADVKAAFPDAKFIDTPDGKRECRIDDHTPDKHRMRLLNEMFRPKNRLDAEIGAAFHAREPEVVLKQPGGGVRFVKASHQELVERKTGARKPRARSRFTVTTFWDKHGVKWERVGDGEWRRCD